MLKRRGRMWWIRFKENGERKAYSLKTDDLVEARLREKAEIAKRDARKATRLADERLMMVAGVSRDDGWGWAIRRWSSMTHKEKQAVVFSRFGGRCVYCRKEVTIPLARERSDRSTPNRAVLDHKTPVSGGGSDGLENIVLSCADCNLRKHDGNAPPVSARA